MTEFYPVAWFLCVFYPVTDSLFVFASSDRFCGCLSIQRQDLLWVFLSIVAKYRIFVCLSVRSRIFCVSFIQRQDLLCVFASSGIIFRCLSIQDSLFVFLFSVGYSVGLYIKWQDFLRFILFSGSYFCVSFYQLTWFLCPIYQVAGVFEYISIQWQD